MAASDSTTDISDSDFESDFESSHVLKSFDVDIDQVTSIAFSTVGEMHVALISTNNSLIRNIYCQKSGNMTPFSVNHYTKDINSICFCGSIFVKSSHDGRTSIDIFYLTQTTEDTQMIDLERSKCLKQACVSSCSITGVCYTNAEEHVAACLVDSHSYTVTNKSCRLIRIFEKDCFTGGFYTKTSIGLYHNIEFDGEERLFTYPRRIALSSSNDFWVVNRTTEQCGDVTVVGMVDGKLKFRYTRRVGNIPFDPKDVARNINDSMIIADCRNHAIHLVKNDGTFLQYIMTQKQGLSFPTAVAVDRDNRLWIGCDFGKMHIVRFNKRFE